MKKKFNWDSVRKVLTVRLRQFPLDEKGRYREDAAFWGYYTHQGVFELNLRNILKSGFRYNLLEGRKPIDASSYHAHRAAMKIKRSSFTMPVLYITAVLAFLFFLCFLR